MRRRRRRCAPETLAEARIHLEALGRFLRAVERHVPADALDRPRALVDQGTTAASTVPGAHGGGAGGGRPAAGSPRLFNALARMDLSPPGHLRPTTAEAHACVWGLDGADALLDWLGVIPRARFTRESVLDAEDEAALRGLVLLDLPDMDSVASAHRVEADRLVGVVDLWSGCSIRRSTPTDRPRGLSAPYGRFATSRWSSSTRSTG